MSIGISNVLLRPKDVAAARLPVPGVNASLEARGLPESDEREASSVEELVLPHRKRQRVEARPALVQSEGERARLLATAATSSAAVLKTLSDIRTSLAAETSDMYTCPRVLFMRAVMVWLDRGRFVDPHMLCPSHLLSLEEQMPSKDDVKLCQNPFLRFAHRDPIEWLDGCAELERVWASLDTHKHLVGSLALLRAHLQHKAIDDVAIIGITKTLMKKFPDPRAASWLQEVQRDPSLVFMAMMQTFTNSNVTNDAAIDDEGDGECEGDDEYEGDGGCEGDSDYEVV